MARIRSIKPDFFTSETIARLPVRARLTFIGLWTHVDDNGVCLFNETLINAALWPLEPDPLESLSKTLEDLRSLSGASLVTLYRHSGKRYLFINSWDEHQKVSHPRKPRYPRPTEPGCEPLTCETSNPPEGLQSDSGDLPETLRPEQGAGSREQGTHTRPAARSASPKRGADDDPEFTAFWAAYPRKEDKGHGRKAWAAAIKKGADPAVIAEAAATFAARCARERTERRFIPLAATWLNGERYNDRVVTPRPAAVGWWDN